MFALETFDRQAPGYIVEREKIISAETVAVVVTMQSSHS